MPIASRRPSGAINFVGIGIAIGAVLLVYLAWVWIPLYSLKWDVKRVVREHGNKAVHDDADDRLVDSMIKALASLQQIEVVDDAGARGKQPLVDVKPGDVVWERSEGPPAMLHVSFSYTLPVVYPVIDRVSSATFSIDEEMDISRPDWGKPK